jgi:hypothetical protein
MYGAFFMGGMFVGNRLSVIGSRCSVVSYQALSALSAFSAGDGKQLSVFGCR